MVCSFLNASLHLALGKYLAFLEGELTNHQSRVRLRLVTVCHRLRPSFSCRLLIIIFALALALLETAYNPFIA